MKGYVAVTKVLLFELHVPIMLLAGFLEATVEE